MLSGKKSKQAKKDKESKPRKTKSTSSEEICEIVMGILKELLPPYLLQSLEPNFSGPGMTKKLPPIQDNNYREPVPEIPGSDEEEESLDDPMEIDFVRRKEPATSLATIPCKIKHLKIPALVLDSGAEPPITSEDIVKRVNWPIDKSEKYDLSGVVTVPTEFISIACNLPITFPLFFFP